MDYGVCRLALVPVRRGPDHRSEQGTQLLFGDHYEVLQQSSDRKWIHIRIHADLFEGWIDSKQHHSITKEYFDQINYANYKITTDISCSILYKKSTLTILMGSIVPISNSELFKVEEQFAFNGEAKSLGQKRDAEFLKTVVGKYVNAPYLLGGKSPFGIDDAGLVQMAFKISGYSLQREVAQQSNQGRKIKDFAEAQAGDLLFFKDGHGEVNHVGIMFDEERIVHADGRVRFDLIMEEGILNPETKVFTHTLAGIRRVFAPPSHG